MPKTKNIMTAAATARLWLQRVCQWKLKPTLSTDAMLPTPKHCIWQREDYRQALIGPDTQGGPTMRFHWTSIFAAVAVLSAVAITAPPVSAQSGRAINVNGQWLNPYQIAQVDQIAGFRLPNGYYWWNPRACVWGVVGNPLPMGRAPCGGNMDARGNVAAAPPGYNRRTLGGDMMSDGRCSFVLGVPVGNCN
jgi:hypothetical protein